MADNRNFAALDWLIHEISETLKEARQSLESYVENPKDAARTLRARALAFCPARACFFPQKQAHRLQKFVFAQGLSRDHTTHRHRGRHSRARRSNRSQRIQLESTHGFGRRLRHGRL